MGLIEDCRALSDADLTRDVKFSAQRDRHCLAKALVHLAEFDRRQLCVREGGESLFAYCTRVLGYDEFDAFRRIRAARTINRFPAVVPLIEEGKISLTAIAVLSPYLKPENYRAWLTEVAGKSRREIEALIAARHPQSERPDYLRRFPQSHARVGPEAPPQALEALPSAASPRLDPTAPSDQAPSLLAPALGSARPHEWQAVVPVAMDRVRIGFDAGIAVVGLIERARQLLRHKYPEGRLEDILQEALQILLERKDPQRRLTLKSAPAASRDPAPSSSRAPRGWLAGRYIPAWVKRAVWERDEGRCAWRFADGTPCGSKDWLEYDHVRPFAKGGRSDTPRNIRLLCRVHNQLAAAAQGLSAKAPGGK
ncbi:MAG: HNH endonuclease [Elusimicrobia bacterium]|nr:HNH endonuclease [Elusimicrobiota bacterium]